MLFFRVEKENSDKGGHTQIDFQKETLSSYLGFSDDPGAEHISVIHGGLFGGNAVIQFLE
jgi:hypothetical protein